MGSEKGNFKADIAEDAIAAALAAIEGKKPSAEGEEIEIGGVTVEAGGAGDGSGEDEAGATPPPPRVDGSSEKVRRLEAMLEDSANRAAQTAERLKETHERYVRLAADFDNFKKRQAKEREDTLKFAAEKLVKDLLPVVDNLERALAAEGDVASLRQGVKLVLNQFLAALAKAGVQPFDAVGLPFDPSRHEALMQAASDTHPAGTVAQEFVRGYMIADRVARPSAVVVSTGPAPAGEGPQEGT